MTQRVQHEWARLLKGIHEEVNSLLLSQYVFRTVQEIIRHNTRLHKYPGLFVRWTCTVYGATTTIAVRRLAGPSYDKHDVSLVRLLDLMMRDAGELWNHFDRYFRPDLLTAHSKAAMRASNDDKQCRIEACNRLIGVDRKRLLDAAKKAVHFANKRVAHKNQTVTVHTNFNDLDEAIETVKTLTEKYLLLAYEKKHDLLREINPHSKWDKIFLEPWATPDILALGLGEKPPP